jgi:hypothetical protein
MGALGWKLSFHFGLFILDCSSWIVHLGLFILDCSCLNSLKTNKVEGEKFDVNDWPTLDLVMSLTEKLREGPAALVGTSIVQKVLKSWFRSNFLSPKILGHLEESSHPNVTKNLGYQINFEMRIVC